MPRATTPPPTDAAQLDPVSRHELDVMVRDLRRVDRGMAVGTVASALGGATVGCALAFIAGPEVATLAAAGVGIAAATVLQRRKAAAMDRIRARAGGA